MCSIMTLLLSEYYVFVYVFNYIFLCCFCFNIVTFNINLKISRSVGIQVNGMWEKITKMSVISDTLPCSFVSQFEQCNLIRELCNNLIPMFVVCFFCSIFCKNICGVLNWCYKLNFDDVIFDVFSDDVKTGVNMLCSLYHWILSDEDRTLIVNIYFDWHIDLNLEKFNNMNKKRSSLQMSEIPMYSASVDEPAVMRCWRDPQQIGLSWIKMIQPEMLFLVSASPAQSLSVKQVSLRGNMSSVLFKVILTP